MTVLLKLGRAAKKAWATEMRQAPSGGEIPAGGVSGKQYKYSHVL
jgi:hypothetical protein